MSIIDPYPFMIYSKFMKHIKLNNGMNTIVDDDDFEKLSKYQWRFNKEYAEASTKIDGKRTTIRQHRLIMGLPQKVGIIDHINGNKLDNRKNNLRLCTPSQNRMNTGPNIKNKLQVKGVVYRPTNSKRPYVAFIYKNYKQIYLGSHATIKEASAAYNSAAKRLHGEFAYSGKRG